MKRFALLPLLLLPLLAQAQQGETAPELSVDEVSFTVANSEFTLMHEMGHLLISELQLPVLGREEDAADQLGFMGLFLLQREQHRDDFYAKLMDVADYWRLEWQHAERDGSPVPVWDSHALDAQRFYNIACLAYGSDPDRLDWVLEVSGLPVERALYCPEEYEQAAHAVQWFREHFGRSDERPARHRIRVIYDPPPRTSAGWYRTAGKDSRQRRAGSGRGEGQRGLRAAPRPNPAHVHLRRAGRLVQPHQR